MTTSQQFDTGLRLSPFDPRWRSGIDWESLQREANAKDQKAARIKERNAGKPFLDQPPHFRAPVAKPRQPRIVRAPKPPAKPKHVPVPWVKPDQITAASTANGRRLDSKAGLMRLAMLQRGPMTSNELALVADVKTGRMARDLLGYDISKGIVKVQKDVEPVRYFVPENPPAA